MPMTSFIFCVLLAFMIASAVAGWRSAARYARANASELDAIRIKSGRKPIFVVKP